MLVSRHPHRWKYKTYIDISLQWRHNDYDGVSIIQPHGCLLIRLFRRRSKKTWTLRVTCLCAGNSPVTGEFLAQRASYTENVSIWCRIMSHVHCFITLIWWTFKPLGTGRVYTPEIWHQCTANILSNSARTSTDTVLTTNLVLFFNVYLVITISTVWRQ